MYINADRLVKQFDLLIHKKALSTVLNTYNQAICIAEAMNRKQNVINLCRIVEEKLQGVADNKKLLFTDYLNGSQATELAQNYNLSMRTVYRYIDIVKRSLLCLFSADKKQSREVEEFLQNIYCNNKLKF